MGTQKRQRQKEGRQQRIAAAVEAQERAERRGRRGQIAIGVGILVLIVGGVLLLTLRDTGKSTDATATTTTTLPFPTSTTAPGAAGGPGTVPPPAPGAASTATPTECPPAQGATRTTKFTAAPPMCIDPAKSYTATFDTTAGKVVVALDAQKMPNTVNNFVVLSRYGFYDGTMLFRTDPSIDIIQGGAPTTNSPADPGPGYKIKDEGGAFDFSSGNGKGPFTYEPGQLIMARSAGPDSSGAQFFFSTGPKVKNLDSQGTYLLFGTVTEGLDVLQAVIATHTPFPAGSPNAGLGGGPKDPVVVNSVTITES